MNESRGVKKKKRQSNLGMRGRIMQGENYKKKKKKISSLFGSLFQGHNDRSHALLCLLALRVPNKLIDMHINSSSYYKH